MEDLIELYKRRDALAKENADASDITNIINENWVVKEPKSIILTHSYYENPDFYEHYDNYDAIEVPRVELIPYDYDGVCGVPLTFLGARNRIYIPDYTSIPKCNETKNFCINYLCSQFTIIGLGISNSGLSCGVEPYKKRWRDYRINVQKRVAVDGDLYMVINQEVKVPYARILIKKVS